jgi:hypothetical protein
MQLTTTNRQGFAPATMGEAMEFSKMLAESSMVPRAYQGKPQDIMVCVQWGYELGLAPMQALQNIAVINGKPSVYGDAMMALVQASPVCEGVDEHIEGEGTPNPVAVCVAKRKGRNPVVAKFSVEDAKRAGLWGKQGPWQAYPKRMLQMRARGFALRDAFPDVLKGLITAEEAQDYPDDAKLKERNVTPSKPANPLDAIAPPAVELAPIVEEVKAIIEERPAEELISIGQEFVDALMAAEPVNVELQNDPAESAEPSAEPDVIEHWPLMVPGKDQPHSIYNTQEEWGVAYEDLADRTARAGKAPARDRMTKLRELKDVNQGSLNRIPTVERLPHSNRYQQRLRALGANLEKDPGT